MSKQLGKALITGASAGIGATYAERLARRGHDLLLVARDIQRLEAMAGRLSQDYGVKVEVLKADLNDKTELKAVEDRLRSDGELGLLVNNAGVAGQALFQDISEELWRRYFSVNVDGAFHTIQAVLPHMLHQHAGCIVNISSIWGQRGASCEVTYSCTKAALIGLTRSLAMELAPTHIRVNCVAPGVIRTDMLDALPPEVLPQLAQETPLGRLGTPEDIAHAVAFLAGDGASFITGQVLTCDGGFIL